MNKEWQEITVDFFRELIGDYLNESQDSFQKDTILEILDPADENRRFFVNNLSGLSRGEKKKYVDKVCDGIPSVFDEYLSENVSGVLQVVQKMSRDTFVSMFSDLGLEEISDLVNSKFTELILPIISDVSLTLKIIDSDPKSPMTPLWYKKENGVVVSGLDLKEKDWKLKESQKLIKIRAWSTSDYKQLSEEGY